MTEDDFKGCVHVTAAALFAIMAAYNGMRLCSACSQRNAVNLALYAPLCVWEMRQARLHWSTQRAVPLLKVAARLA